MLTNARQTSRDWPPSTPRARGGQQAPTQDSPGAQVPVAADHDLRHGPLSGEGPERGRALVQVLAVGEWRNSGGGLAAFETVSLGAADLGCAFLGVGVVALPRKLGPTQATAQIDIWRACERLKPPPRSECTAALTTPERFAREPIEIRTPRQFAGGEHERVGESQNGVAPGWPTMFDAGDRFASDV